MQGDWILETTRDDAIGSPADTDALPMAPPRGIDHDDPQAGMIARDTGDLPDAARPLHPEIGGPTGPS